NSADFKNFESSVPVDSKSHVFEILNRVPFLRISSLVVVLALVGGYFFSKSEEAHNSQQNRGRVHREQAANSSARPAQQRALPQNQQSSQPAPVVRKSATEHVDRLMPSERPSP